MGCVGLGRVGLEGALRGGVGGAFLHQAGGAGAGGMVSTPPPPALHHSPQTREAPVIPTQVHLGRGAVCVCVWGGGVGGVLPFQECGWCWGGDAEVGGAG